MPERDKVRLSDSLSMAYRVPFPFGDGKTRRRRAYPERIDCLLVIVA